MFKIHNGRLYADVTPRTVSFAIPEGYWLETMPEGNSEDHIGFRSPDKSAEVEVAVGGTVGSTADDVFQYFDDAPAEELDGPHPITVNGLSGHSIYSCGEGMAQYVVVLDIGGFEDQRGVRYDRIEVTLTIFYEGKGSIEAIRAEAADPAFLTLLESIRVDSEEA